jgi:hypothetical protein
VLQETPKLTADPAEVRRDLEFITARWHELGQPLWLEVRAFRENSAPVILKYRPEPEWIAEAVQAICDINQRGYNVYAVRNPIKDTVGGRSANDDDIAAAFFLWADCDDQAAANNVYRFDGPKWSAAVTTGRTPSVRVHTYWALEQPCTDLAAWRQMQTAIAAHFGSDRSVINPSRIMRVGGTVTFPDARKRGKGYTSEVTTLRTQYEQPRAPVTLEQMARVFGATTPALPLSQQATATAPTAGGLSFDVGTNRKSADEYADVLRRARTDGEKHGGVRDLAAHLAGSGVSRAMAEAIIREACPVWDAGVVKLIDSAYAKFSPADTQFRELSDAEVEAIPALPFKAWQPIDLTAIPRPQFVYSDFYARGYTSLTVAPPKVGKSMLGLAEAIDMATGRGFLSGIPREPARVLYYNAEDDQNVLNARVSALLTHYRIPQSEIVGRLFAVSGVEADGFYLVGGQEGVINEPLFVALEKFVAENQIDAMIFDPLQDLSRSPETNEVFRVLGQRLRRCASAKAVAIGLIHHTRKMPQGGATATIDDARGGGALRGTARFNRLLVPMSEDEAAKAGLPNHRHFMRIGDMESNLAPPSADLNRWFQKINVETPNGDHVGAVEPWTWPNAFDGVTPDDARRVQIAIASMEAPPRANVQAANWVGYVVARVLEWDATDKAIKGRITNLIKAWVKSGVLQEDSVEDTRNGRPAPVIVAGPNNPKTVVDA